MTKPRMPDPAPGGAREITAEHLDRMDAAIRSAGIGEGDPLSPVLSEWRRCLAWGGELTARLEEIAGHVGAGLDPAALARLEQAAASGAARRAAELARARNRRTVLLAAGALVLALGVGAGGGYVAGWRSQVAVADGLAAAFRDGPDAAQAWLGLMRANDVRSMLGGCTGRAVASVAGRRACGMGVWLDPPANTAPVVVPAGG